MAKVKTAAWALTETPATSRSSRRWVPVTGLVMAFVLGFAAAFLIVGTAAGPNSTERRIAELQQEEKDRDKTQTVVLSDLAKGSRDRLTPVLAGMAAVIPVDAAAPSRAPTADEVKGWREVLSKEVERHNESPSAGNGVNVTRIALRAAVKQLAVAADTFEITFTVAEPDKARLLVLAGEQRTLALRTWSAAAIQLDVINIEAGHGHVHAYLTEDPGTSPGDGVPEGTGRR